MRGIPYDPVTAYNLCSEIHKFLMKSTATALDSEMRLELDKLDDNLLDFMDAIWKELSQDEIEKITKREMGEELNG